MRNKDFLLSLENNGIGQRIVENMKGQSFGNIILDMPFNSEATGEEKRQVVIDVIKGILSLSSVNEDKGYWRYVIETYQNEGYPMSYESYIAYCKINHDTPSSNKCGDFDKQEPTKKLPRWGDLDRQETGLLLSELIDAMQHSGEALLEVKMLAETFKAKGYVKAIFEPRPNH